jgi:hypothetical protein
MHWLDGSDRRNSNAITPRQKFPDAAGVSAACVRVPDVGGEKFKETLPRLVTGGGDEGGHFVCCEWCELFHGVTFAALRASTIRKR